MIEFIKAIPVIISFILQVKKWIDQEQDLSKRKEALSKVSDAFSKATKEGTTNEIEALFRSRNS